MATKSTTKSTGGQGVDGFLRDLHDQIDAARQQGRGTRDFVLQIAERYSYIRLADIKNPIRFLKQISSNPPICFGTAGFRQSIVDDQEPARHYTAFVFVGYWLPIVLALPVLWAWEILGFFRYGKWSQPDIRSGNLGVRHGRAVRKAGPTVLPTLIQRDLSERS